MVYLHMNTLWLKKSNLATAHHFEEDHAQIDSLANLQAYHANL